MQCTGYNRTARESLPCTGAIDTFAHSKATVQANQSILLFCKSIAQATTGQLDILYLEELLTLLHIQKLLCIVQASQSIIHFCKSITIAQLHNCTGYDRRTRESLPCTGAIDTFANSKASVQASQSIIHSCKSITIAQATTGQLENLAQELSTLLHLRTILDSIRCLSLMCGSQHHHQHHHHHH